MDGRYARNGHATSQKTRAPKENQMSAHPDDRSGHLPSTPTSEPQSVGALTRERLVKKLRDLNVCDPECEGRCLVCPEEMVLAAAAMLSENPHDENCDTRDTQIAGKPCNCYLTFKTAHVAEKLHADGLTEKLAIWMMKEGFITGHGDSVDDLLQELSSQIAERADGLAERVEELERLEAYLKLNRRCDYPEHSDAERLLAKYVGAEKELPPEPEIIDDLRGGMSLHYNPNLSYEDGIELLEYATALRTHAASQAVALEGAREDARRYRCLLRHVSGPAGIRLQFRDGLRTTFFTPNLLNLAIDEQIVKDAAISTPEPAAKDK